MKQTVVEWIEEKLKENLKHIVINNDYVLIESIFLQAKAMEKEQIKEAYKSCYTPLSFGKIGDLDEDFKEWFEQFKKKDKQ